MSRSGYPKHVIIHHADALTDRLSLHADAHLYIDGRWSAQTVRSRMMAITEGLNLRLNRGDKPEHQVYAAGYTVIGNSDHSDANTAPGHPMPYVTRREFWHRFVVPVPGVVGEVFACNVVRKMPDSRGIGGSYEVFGPHGIVGDVFEVRTSVVRIVDRESGRQYESAGSAPFGFTSVGHALDLLLQEYVTGELNRLAIYAD